MTGGATVNRVQGDYSDTELRTVAATLVGLSSADVCEVAVVMIFHPPGGGHEMLVLVDTDKPAADTAALLRHVADHCHGGCEPCRQRNRQRGRHRGG